MNKLLILLLATTISASQVSCLKYNCTTKEVGKGEACAKQEINIVSLVKCQKGLVCPTIYKEMYESRCEEPIVIKNSLLAGQYCNSDDECYSKSCKENVCKGVSANKKCSDTKECDVDLYCNGIVCLEPTNICNATARCSSNKFCHMASHHCYSYGELELNVTSLIAPACKSYYLYNSTCFPGPIFFKDNNDSTCNYTFNRTQIQKDAICGKNLEGKKYCEKGRGDIEIADVMFN